MHMAVCTDYYICDLQIAQLPALCMVPAGTLPYFATSLCNIHCTLSSPHHITQLTLSLHGSLYIATVAL